MSMKDLEKMAEDYFNDNAGTTELFGTSDGTLFMQKQHATCHAKGLDNNTVQIFTAAKTTKRSKSLKNLK